VTNPSQTILSLLRQFESRNVTFIEADGSWPVVWERAKGVYVWDVNGKRYLDLTAAFGVAAAGHANPAVVKAGQRQMSRLLHAMGDIHPHPLKAQLARELSRVTFERWTQPQSHGHGLESELPAAESGSGLGAQRGKCILASSGFEAVEAALKTALLFTGKPGIIAFEGGYHGLGYGALNATHRAHFRSPFRPQLAEFGSFVPYPAQTAQVATVTSIIEALFRRQAIGAILVEPIQGRGGIRIPPPEFLPQLRALCDTHRALLIADEIFTGFGRTGLWFACEHTRTVPDLVCLGKALTGGFPISACVGKADLMDAAWPESDGEAIHTSTFLGHPVGCAMALAQIAEIRRRDLVSRSARLGDFLRTQLTPLLKPPLLTCRGLGLMVGLELREPDNVPATARALRLIKTMLQRGFILLPEGEAAHVISLTPPLTISPAQLRSCVHGLASVLP
jgi:4-aminobutyrate aminotransferase-like enzyme